MVAMLLLGIGLLNASERVIVLDTAETLDAALSVQKEAERIIQSKPEAENFWKQSGLHIVVEPLEDYYIVTVSSLHNTAEENSVNILLKQRFPHAFSVPKWHTVSKHPAQIHASKQMMQPVAKRRLKTHEKSKKSQIEKKSVSKQFIEGMDNEWIALIILALLGLILVMRSTHQIKKIKQLQHKLEETQKRNSQYLNSMGKQYE